MYVPAITAAAPATAGAAMEVPWVLFYGHEVAAQTDAVDVDRAVGGFPVLHTARNRRIEGSVIENEMEILEMSVLGELDDHACPRVAA